MNARVCLAGDFSFDRLGASWYRALQTLGREVVQFDVRTVRNQLDWIARNRVLHRLTINSYDLRHQAARRYNEALYAQVMGHGANVLFLHNGEFVFPETLARLKADGVKIVVFFADNPFPPNYANRPETIPSALQADLYLVWSERLAAKLRRVGVAGARYFPFGWDPVAFPYDVPSQTQWDGVVFVGGWDRERERILDRVAAHYPLRIFGPPYWSTRTRRDGLARKRWMGRALEGNEAATVARGSAISLNILRSQHYIDGVPDGLIMRHFEVPGVGGFLLSTRGSGAVQAFPEGISGAYFSGEDEMLGRIDDYLLDPDSRRRIARSAHCAVRDFHTYDKRVDALLKVLGHRPFSVDAVPQDAFVNWPC